VNPLRFIFLASLVVLIYYAGLYLCKVKYSRAAEKCYSLGVVVAVIILVLVGVVSSM